MARITLATFGSLGDLHPTIALARALQQRGHTVIVATSEPYRAQLTALGLTFRALRPDLALGDEALVRRIMDGSKGSEYLMRELVFPVVRQMHADLTAVAAESDLLVTSELVCAAPLIGEQTGRPWAFYSLSPISFFPLADPPLLPGPPGSRFVQSLGPTANRAYFALAKLASYSWWAPMRQLRRELGLPPGASPLFGGKFSPHLNLALFSPVIQEPQSDWPASTVQTGFLFHDEFESRPQLPGAVESFLANGDPPIVFTLGSAAVALAGDFYAVSARAAQLLGRRAVLLLGRNPPPPNLPSSILAWDYLPYAQIFPHAAAIVHQGGIGTTAQTLRAGKPMLVLPFAHDQFDNAARVTRLGVAQTLSRRQYRPERVASALGRLFKSPSIIAASVEIGARVRAEDGPRNACAALEQLVSA